VLINASPLLYLKYCTGVLQFKNCTNSFLAFPDEIYGQGLDVRIKCIFVCSGPLHIIPGD
jgi:hypothetical protein